MTTEKNAKDLLGSATKWSLYAEIFAKLVAPITNAVLARLLVPEAFGYVATINMIISFTDIFTDAGFQKYIIQHEFDNKEEKDKCINVAFWSNLILSVILFGLLLFFRDSVASFTGSPNIGWGIAVAGLSLPITSFSSIQMSVFKREMDFKTLFYVRVITAIIPLFVTIPLALVLQNYWALVIGTLLGNLSTSIILTIKSSWKPSITYDFKLFKRMFTFCYWILIESILVWLTSYIGTFVVGVLLNPYYVGVYKTSMITVNQLVAVIVNATSPVIFSATSRLQNKREEMITLFLKSLKMISYILIPMGIGIFLYRNCIVSILLGSQWDDTIQFIGVFAICNSYGLVLSSYWDGMFNAIGKPKYSVITQILYLIILVPMIVIGAGFGYEILWKVRCVSKIVYIFVELTAVWLVFKLNFKETMACALPATIACIPMIVASLLMQLISTNIVFELIQIIICIIIYFATLCMFNATRKDLHELFSTMNISIPKSMQKIINSR